MTARRQTEAKVYRFRHPGQCCGLCRLAVATGKEGRWDALECHALGHNGEPLRLPVIPEAGTHCRFWRERKAQP